MEWFGHVTLQLLLLSNWQLPADAATDLRGRCSAIGVLLTIHVRSAELLERQRTSCIGFERFGPYEAEEVQARQCLNAEVALQEALAGGFHWLVHIDSDELFYSAAPSVVPHFEMLSSRGIQQMTYVNHEGVPESEDIVDYFTAVTLFKRHHFCLPVTSDVQACMRFWQGRTHQGQYLIAYDNGKCAVAVRPGLYPTSVHRWTSAADPGFEAASFAAFADPRRLDPSKVLTTDDPCILHFVVCGLQWFRTKYEMLGRFPDSWFGDTLPIAPCFHRDARDALWAPDGLAHLTRMYHAQVLMSEGTHPGEVSRQLAAGVCVRSNDHVAAVSTGGAALGMTPHGVPPGGPGLALNSGGGSVEGCTLMVELDGALAAMVGAGGGAGSGGGGVAPPESSPPAPPAQSLRTVSAHDKAWLIASITKQYL